MTSSGPTEPVAPLDTGRAPPAEHVPPGQTTVPRYPAGPVLDPAPHLVVTVGEHAAGVARDLLRHRPPGRDRHVRLAHAGSATGGPGTGDAPPAGRGTTDRTRTGPAEIVGAELSAVVTGWRVLAVGPERDVQAVRAAALARGALDAEITLVPTDVDEDVRIRPVFCGACHHLFDARAAVGAPLACPACRAVLTLAPHHSRRHAAFLGAPAGDRAPADQGPGR